MHLAAIGGIEMHRHRRRAFPAGLRDQRVAHLENDRVVVDSGANFVERQDAHRIFFAVSALTFLPETTTTAGCVARMFPLMQAAIVTAAVGSIRY